MRMPHLVAAGLIAALPATGALAQTVTVQPGDTLSIIARAQLGDVSRWRDLCNINADVLNGNCDRLSPGMVLALPGGAAAADAVEATAVPPAPREEPAAEVEAEPEVEAEAQVVDTRVDLIPASIPNGEQVFNLANTTDLVFTAPSTFTAVREEGADYVSLSGHVADEPASGRPGIWIGLSPEFEAAAAGRTVQIDALVRGTPGGRFDLAYSTNEAGHSGWNSLEAATAFGTISMLYDVPENAAENGDFIGILPDPNGTGQVVDVSFIAVTVVE